MTTDAFTTAARAEAEHRWPSSGPRNLHRDIEWHDEGMASGFVLGAQWSAAQEPTEEDLDRALLAFLAAENLAVIPGVSRERAEEYAREEMEHGVERVREALRAALAAARAVRPEKR